MLCFIPRGELKKPDPGLYVITESNASNMTFKGAPKLYFIHYLGVTVIFLIKVLYKSVFSTLFFFFGNLGFSLFVFRIFMFLYLWFLAFTLLLDVLNSMSFLIISDFITFFNFLLRLFFKNLDDLLQNHKVLIPRKFQKIHQKYSSCCHSGYVNFL